MNIPKIEKKQLDTLFGEVDNSNKKPFLDFKGEVVDQGDFVIISNRLASGHWLAYGLVIENAGYWSNMGFGEKYYQPLLEVRSVKHNLEIEDTNVDYCGEVIKVDRNTIPKQFLDALLES